MISSDALHSKRDVPELPAKALRPVEGALPARTLYVYEDAERLGWSTRLRTLLAQPDADLSPDPLGFAEQLAGTLGRSPRTLFARIRRLPLTASAAAAPEGNPADALLDTLDGWLARHLAPTARPSLLLGSGLYSRLLAAALHRQGRSFDAAVLRDSGSQDHVTAQALARACGAPLVEIDADALGPAATWKQALLDLDEPTATAADLALHGAWRLLQQAGAGILLSGHGGHALVDPLGDAPLDAPSIRQMSPWLGRQARARVLAAPGEAGMPGAHHTITAPGPWDPAAVPLGCPFADRALHRPRSRAELAARAASRAAALLQDLPALGAHRSLRCSARTLLADGQKRLQEALVAFAEGSAADMLESTALADLLGSHYAGQDTGRALSTDFLWRAALLLLWWTEVLPGLRAVPRIASATPGREAAATSSSGLGSQTFSRQGRPRLLVYTVLIGAKESLADPLAGLPADATSDLDLEFVCLTDNPSLTSTTWRMQLIPSGHLPPEKMSRRPKALPHLYFPEHRHSLYIDNTVSFKRLPQASDLHTARPYLFKAYRHATRSNPLEEAAAVAMLGYEDVDTICRQLGFYGRRRPLDRITPLTTATVLLRDHARDEVQRFGMLWWESVLAFSKRDQLSFDFALQEASCAVEYFEGSTHDNAFIHWNGGLSERRVKASFDSQRYAWLHRDDPEAQRDPRAHFLAHAGDSGSRYDKPVPLLEYVAWQQGSSLGSQVSPRRGLCAGLEPLLSAHRREGQTYLLLRVRDGRPPRAWAAAEHETAAQALSMVLSPARGTLIDIPAVELDREGRVYMRPEPPCDLVIVLGAQARQALATVQLLHRMVDPARGQVVLALCDSLSLRQAAELEAWLAAQYRGVTMHSQLQASTHDDATQALPNTLLALQWEPVTAEAAA